MPANTSPIFTLTPNIGKGKLDTANTNRDGTGTIVTLFTAGANGSKINRIAMKADAQPADSTVMFYLHDGTTYFAWEEWDIGAPAAGSATVTSYQESRFYDDLVLPTGWTLRASITAALTAGKLHVLAFGGDF